MMIPQDVEEAACAGRLAKGEAAARQSAQVSSRAAVRFAARRKARVHSAESCIIILLFVSAVEQLSVFLFFSFL